MHFKKYYDKHSRLLDDIASANPNRRRKAAIALRTYDHPDTFKLLIRLLNDRVEAVRDEAALSLSKIGDVKALPALLECFLDPTRKPEPDSDGDVSWIIPFSIANFGDEAIKYLMPYRNDPTKKGISWLFTLIQDEHTLNKLNSMYYAEYGVKPFLRYFLRNLKK